MEENTPSTPAAETLVKQVSFAEKISRFVFICILIGFGALVLNAYLCHRQSNAVKPGQVWVKEIYKSDNPFDDKKYSTNTVLKVVDDWVRWETTYRRVREPDALYIGGFNPMPITESKIEDFKRDAFKLSDPPAFVEKIVTVTNTVVKEVSSLPVDKLLTILEKHAEMFELFSAEIRKLKDKQPEWQLLPYTNYLPYLSNSLSTNICITNSIIFGNEILAATNSGVITLEFYDARTNYSIRPARELKRGVFR